MSLKLYMPAANLSPTRTARLRRAVQRIGAHGFFLLGLATEMAWAFFGSLVLGLGVRPVGRPVALLWLAGAVAIALAFGLTVWLSTPPSREP